MSEYAEQLQLSILEEMRRIANRKITDPNQDFLRRINSFLDAELSKWERNSTDWVEVDLPRAYRKGITNQDSELRTALGVSALAVPLMANIPGLPSQVQFDNLSEKTRKILSDYPKHFSAFSVIENDTKDNLRRTTGFVFRSSMDLYRNISTESLSSAFQSGDRATRRDLSQGILDRYADRGIEGIRYSNGRRVSIEAYAEMVARSTSQRSAREASINRQAERGYDLTRVSQHAGSSDLCFPWQGRVYSISGESNQYPAFSSATFDGSTGLWHPNCRHSNSVYIPGVSEPITLTDSPQENVILERMGESRGNRYIYDQSQMQRYNERKIREWKRRKAVSLEPHQRERADRFIKKWQGIQREHIDRNPFLRRKYVREAA